MTQEAMNIYNQGYYLYMGINGYPRDHKKALAYFLKAAQLGVSDAMNCLGLMCENGDCVNKDYKKAAEWFFHAIRADSKNKYAIYNLGRMYYCGSGVTKNNQYAYNYFSNASELGLSDAMNYLGIMYENGEFVDKDYKKACEWFLRSIIADNGNRFAAYNLARMYCEGTGVEKNYDKAFIYAEAANVVGYRFADIHFAKSCYLTGWICLEHYKKYKDAADHFFCAIEYGNIPEAWHNLGWMATCQMLPSELYGNKKPIKKIDIDLTARFFYEEAAKLGYAPAMARLGGMHIMYGDIKSANHWLSKAAKMGYEPAIKSLKMLKAAATLNKIASWIPSPSPSTINNQINTFSESTRTSFAQKYSSNTIFQDARGNYCTPGTPFYDYRGNLCEWGSPFYDFKGNLCEWGSPFYDSKGNYCSWGSPFYDARGNYIAP